MSKELKALEDLINFIGNGEIADTHELCEYVAKRKDIIETALKDYERLKTSYLENLLNEESKEYLYKKLKALEIIKEKVMTLVSLDNGDVWKGHYRVYDSELYLHNELTKEEYDLLKEVLDND